MHHHQILLTPQLKPLTLNSKPDIMYCKKCGKVIPDDSLFCQYCGEQLSDSKPPKKQMWKSPLSRFQSLSRGWQICIMSYVCWAFLWIILCLTAYGYEDEQGMYIDIFVFVLPILALFIWYYFTHLRKGAKNKETLETASYPKEVAPSDVQRRTKYSIFPLLSFSESFGKMQVKVERDNNGFATSYCTFTNAEGVVTKVNFSETTNGMTAADISEHKERLYVLQTADSSYQLVKL